MARRSVDQWQNLTSMVLVVVVWHLQQDGKLITQSARCFDHYWDKFHARRLLQDTSKLITRAVLSPGNRAKPCTFRYVKSVRNFMWKLFYRKDDHAMRPIRGCSENFRDSWLRPRLLFPTFSRAFVLMDPMNVPAKFEIRSFTRLWDRGAWWLA